ncbi:MAG: hypothetical protein KGI71_05290 [Patescibacteria group bacterium]|nr:hypothetical protein [Patescibacteria group bacterium]
MSAPALTDAIEAGDVTIVPCAQPTVTLTGLITKMTPASPRQATHKIGDVLYTFFTAPDGATYLRTVHADGHAGWYRLAQRQAAA